MNAQTKAGWTQELDPLDDIETVGDAAVFDIAVTEKVAGFGKSPEAKLARTKDLMREKLKEIDADIKKTKASAEVQIETIKADEKADNDDDQARIDGLRAQIDEITQNMKSRSAGAKERIKAINEGRDYQIAYLNEFRISAEAFLSASARKAC